MSEFLNNIHFMRPIWLTLLIPTVVMTVWLAQRTLRKGRWDQLIDPALQAPVSYTHLTLPTIYSV